MPGWTQEFAFSVGDRVAIVPPPDTDEQWRKFDGRYGTVGRVLMECGDGQAMYIRYRVDLETAPRGKGKTLWCREDYMRKAKEGVKRG